MGQFVLYIMVLFSTLGAIDKLLGNKFGLGNKFVAGFMGMGSLAMTMIGIYCISPVLAQYILPILTPISSIIGVDPSIFLSSILACDMGGYNTALEISANGEIAKFAGIILASMMGATVSFTIPIATNQLSKEDFDIFAKGVLCGIVTIPLGTFVGGMLLHLPFKVVIVNLFPVIIFSILIAICLINIQDKIVKIFVIFGKIIFSISLIGLIFSILDFVLGIKIIPNMIPFEEGIIVVGKITVILSGAYPLIHLTSQILKKSLSSMSNKLGINEISILGIFTSMANSVPMLGVFDKMDWKGKIVNSAFAVSGAFVFGGQLGFVSGVSKETVTPFIISKLVAGISGICVAILLIKVEEKRQEENICK